MNRLSRQSLDHLQQRGYVMLPHTFDSCFIDSLAKRLTEKLESRTTPSTLRSRGQTYGSRNLLEVFPELVDLLSPSLKEVTTTVLGPAAGIVRVLYFDKPPDRSWSLPWHKDRTIAVKRNDLPSKQFRKPTIKAGIPHVEAPESILENMLTLRIHLDAMSEANGPLYVMPGSHRGEEHDHPSPVELHADVGDVLLMRPLLSHSSRMSRHGTTSHRRVIHIETAANAEPSDGYEWYFFIPFR